MRRRLTEALALALALGGCADPFSPEEVPLTFQPPSDDPDDWDIDTSVSWRAVLSEPQWVVPAGALPDETPTYASNNNVALEIFEGRLFLAWRTSETHWASPNTVTYVVSSPDWGETWEYEASWELGTDAREPNFYVMGDELTFTFFEAGSDTFAFEPRALWRTRRLGPAEWEPLEDWGADGEVVWDIRKRGGRLYRTSYVGNHYGTGESDVDVLFHVSDDGRSWDPVPGGPVVYHGGASESSWELDAEGGLWAVLRNEDGDDTGFGALVCHTPPGQLAPWECPTESDPERYDSPRMLRHGDDLYLVARRDLGGPFDQGNDELDPFEQRQQYAAAYWNRPKRTALYRVRPDTSTVEHVLDFPSAGDTAFPAIRRVGPHSFLIANYTSPVDDPDRTWIEGQGAVDGTQIYLITLRFEPEG